MTHEEHSDESTRDATGTGEQPSRRGTSGLATHLAWALHLDEKQAEKVAEIAAQWADGEGEYAFSRCESPAERLFLLGGLIGEHEDSLQLRDGADPETIDLGGGHSGDTWTSDGHIGECGDLVILSQVPIGRYRADFMLVLWMRQPHQDEDAPLTRVVVEVDGHDFHSTKEQLAADHERDIELLRLGVPTIRFTGSQVYADPCACFERAIGIAKCLDGVLKSFNDERENAFWEGRRIGPVAMIADPEEAAK